MKPSNTKISIALTKWGQKMQGKTPTKEDGDSIDMVALAEMPEYQEIITKLKSLGVKSSSHLMELGFAPAGMLIRF